MSLAMTLLAALSGALVGLGAWVGLAAIGGWPVLPVHLSTDSAGVFGVGVMARRLPDRTLRMAVPAGLVVGVLVAAALRLPVIALLAAGVVWVSADAMRGPSVPELNRLGAAVASWCETIRQELDAGQPLRAAVVAACDMPPRGLEEPLERLATRLETEPLPEALWGFAGDVRHPAVGQTVAALEVAYRLGAGDLPQLMAGQVETTRHRVQTLRDLHAARAKHRRAMALLLTLFLAVVVVLFLAWPDFLNAYRSAQGQLVLAGVAGTVLGSIRALVRLSQPALPPDFFADRAHASHPEVVPP